MPSTVPLNRPSSSMTFMALAMLTGLLTGLLIVGCGGSGGHDASTEPAAPVVPPAAPPTETASAPPSTPLGTSAVMGTVSFAGTAPRLKPIAMDADPGCAAKHDGPAPAEALVLGDGQTLGNVFVQVANPPDGTFPAPTEPATVDQKGCLYVPHVLGVMAGQTLVFHNSDGLLHNVHGLPKTNREFNMGMPPTVTEATASLAHPEPVFPVKCDVHPWMRLFVAVMSHPFFAVTDSTGAFRIEGLPAGQYEIEAWHERLGTQKGSVTVEEGGAGTVDFSFSVPS